MSPDEFELELKKLLSGIELMRADTAEILAMQEKFLKELEAFNRKIAQGRLDYRRQRGARLAQIRETLGAEVDDPGDPLDLPISRRVDRLSARLDRRFDIIFEKLQRLEERSRTREDDAPGE